MFCTITFGMALSSVSVAALPCDNFKLTTPPTVQVASLDVGFIPMPVPAVRAIRMQTKKRKYADTAIYNISAHTVIMPDGSKLEAHSGYGSGLDNVRMVTVRMRGPTPPNSYDLTMRESLFHGIKTIRLNPVNEDRMHGRAGMLIHPYMMGPDGASNGCVSIRDYDSFFRAFKRGRVKHMIVTAGNVQMAERDNDQ